MISPTKLSQRENQKDPADQSSIDWSKVGRGVVYGASTGAVFGAGSKALAMLGVQVARDLSMGEYVTGVLACGLIGGALVAMGREGDVLPRN